MPPSPNLQLSPTADGLAYGETSTMVATVRSRLTTSSLPFHAIERTIDATAEQALSMKNRLCTLHVFSAHLFAALRVGVSVGQGHAELSHCAALTPDCK